MGWGGGVYTNTAAANQLLHNDVSVPFIFSPWGNHLPVPGTGSGGKGSRINSHNAMPGQGYLTPTLTAFPDSILQAHP